MVLSFYIIEKQNISVNYFLTLHIILLLAGRKYQTKTDSGIEYVVSMSIVFPHQYRLYIFICDDRLHLSSKIVESRRLHKYEFTTHISS